MDENIEERLKKIEDKIDIILSCVGYSPPVSPLLERYEQGLREGKSHSQIHREIRADQERESQKEYKKIMKAGSPQAAYIHRNRIYREGCIHNGFFYYNWGGRIATIPVKNVELIQGVKNE